MQRTIIISAVVVICVGLVTWLLLKIFSKRDETETMYCGPDKTIPVKVFVNPSEAYPVFAKDYTAKVQGNLSVMDSITKMTSPSAAGTIEIADKVVQLRDNLTQESIRMEILMKSNFYAYNARPCDSEVSKNYFEFIRIMADKTSELDKLKADLTNATTKGAGGDTATLSIVQDTAKINMTLRRFEKNYHFIVSDTDKTLPPALRNKLRNADRFR